MEFSLWNFKEWYAKHDIDLSYIILDNSATIAMLTTSTDTADGRLGLAVVRSGEDLSDCSGFHSVLSYGRDRILFPVASPAQVLDVGMLMIETYTSWENELLDAIAHGASAEEVLRAGCTRFPFPCAFFLPNGSLLFQTEELPNELYALLRSSDAARLRGARDKAQFRNLLDRRAQTVLSETLYFQDTVLGLLIACEGTGKFQPGDLNIFHTLADAIKTAFCFRPDALTAFHPLSAWFTKAIAISAPCPPMPDALLQQIGWSPDDHYAVASISLKQHSISFPSQLAAMTDNDHCCVSTPNGFSLLIHQQGTDLQHEIERLRYYCPASSCTIGLSLPFRTLSNAYWYHQQSLWALHKGQQHDRHLCTIQGFLPAAIRRAMLDIPEAQALIHPAILRLAQKSAASGEPLLETFFAFLICGCSISHAADSLSVHRNTLRARIKTIANIIPAPWDDPALREQYILSLLLLQPDAG
ncbi:MAG: helix-turn-helix domain-containing protein [Eubacteriales bacterium]|nr:helix-turn-helix domain-containing protein [Eubacteriales bacterium]